MNGYAGSSRPKRQKQELAASNRAVPVSEKESGDPVVGLAVRIVEIIAIHIHCTRFLGSPSALVKSAHATGLRTPRLVQRLRTRPRGSGPRPGPSFAGAGGDRRGAGGLTCRSRPSAMWRSPARSFVGYRPSGITDDFSSRPP